MIKKGKKILEYIPKKDLLPEIRLPEEYERFPKEMNLTEELLDKNLEKGRKNRVALFYENQRMTYKDLYYKVNRLGNALLDLGIDVSDRVGFCSFNSPEAIVINFAILKIGAIPVPMHPRWSSHEFAYVGNNAEIKAAVAGSDKHIMSVVEATRKDIPSIQHLIAFGIEPEEAKEEGYVPYEELIKEGGKKLEPVRKDKKEEPAIILYTSGTTGPPKGCVHFTAGILALCDSVGNHVWHLTEEDVIGGPAQVTMAAGYCSFATTPFRFGSALSLWSRFRPERVFELIEKHGITVLSMLPTAYRALLLHPKIDEWLEEYDISSLRRCTGGAEALGEWAFKKWKEKIGIEIAEGLGTSEMFHITISSGVAPKGPKPGSFGVAIPGVEAKVINPETGQPCKPGEIGSIYIKGPTGTIYWKPFADDNRLLKKQKESVIDGWNVLGDYATVDEDGYIWFLFREEDMIKTMGYRIGPKEIEEVIDKHSAVAEAAVIGVPHSIRGEDVKAIVHLKENYEPSEELRKEIMDFIGQKIAKFKLPRLFEFVSEAFPKTAAGKLSRRELRKREEGRDQTPFYLN